MATMDFYIYLSIVSLIVFSSSLIIYQRLLAPKKRSLLYFSIAILVISLFFLPFIDLFRLEGFLASVILGESLPSIYTTISIFLLGNIGIYGITIFYSCLLLMRTERYKEGIIEEKQFSKKRHPLYASFHIIGLSYHVLMGSITGSIIVTIIMILLFLEARRIEKKILIPKFRNKYLSYMRAVPRLIYSWDILLVLGIIYLDLMITIVLII